MLNGTQLAVLKTELQNARYAELLALQDYEAIAALLNDRPTVDNPVAQPDRAKRFTWATFLALLTVAERLALYTDYGNFAGDLRRTLEQDDRVEMIALWTAIKTVMLPATVTKVETAFAASEPDPTWSATIPGESIAMAHGWPRCEARDIQAVAA